VPFVLTGHNERIAWGITSGGWDVTEQYLLRRDPANEKRYWVNGKWNTMEARKYRIQVKGHDDEEWTTDQTVFGPLVKKDSIAYALRWLPQYSASSVYSFWKMMKAVNWVDFRQALRSYDYPSQNFVYADVEKNIGMVCAGKMPVKPKGYSGGMLDGTSMPEEKFIPFDSLPQCFDPARNYLFSANQEPERSGHYYSSRWFDDLYRPQRIDQLLASEKKFDMEDMRQMQLDITDLSVQDLKALLNKYRPAGKSKENWALLMKWDGQLKADEKEAVFYKDFISAARITGNDLAARLGVKAMPRFDPLVNFLLHYDSIPFRKTSIYARDWFERIVNVTDSLYTLNGNPATARYIYSFNIPQMTFLPVFDKGVDNIGGSENTINVNYGAHPVIRTLIEIRDGKIYSSMVNAIGQTGRINEKNYYQQLASWEKNNLHSTQFTSDPQQIRAIATTIIFLKNSK
jgi:penicillin amidase